MIYMDYSATTPLSGPVKDKMMDIMENNFGNPSSMHKLGVQSEKIIKSSRMTISKILRVTPEEIYFTSGGTEANNIAVQGIVKRRKSLGNHIITSSFEHPSVLNTFQEMEQQGMKVDYIPVLENGCLDLQALESAIKEDTILVSIMHVNNEIGTIQDIESIGKMIKQKNSDCLFHVDAIQSYCKYPLNLKRIQVDLMSFSAHKIYGPKGVGGLFIKKGINVSPMIHGGQQEKALRPGTENLIGIGAFGVASNQAYSTHKESFEKVSELRNLFLDTLQKSDLDFKVNTPLEASSPYILNVSFDRMRGEVLLHTLESEGVFVSTGSACSSKKKDYSHVLKAVNYSNERMEGAIRFSFSPLLNKNMILEATDIIIKSVKMLDEIIRGR